MGKDDDIAGPFFLRSVGDGEVFGFRINGATAWPGIRAIAEDAGATSILVIHQDREPTAVATDNKNVAMPIGAHIVRSSAAVVLKPPEILASGVRKSTDTREWPRNTTISPKPIAIGGPAGRISARSHALLRGVALRQCAQRADRRLRSAAACEECPRSRAND